MDPPTDTAAQPLPAPTWCYGCGYNLAGLTSDGTCPECGLEIAASRPVWDLRRCHLVYVEHVRAELRWIGWTAAMAGFAAACLAIAAASYPIASVSGAGLDATGAMLVVGIVAVLGAAGPLSVFQRRCRTHPEAGKAITAAPRRSALMGLSIVAMGLGFVVLPGVVIANFLAGLGTIIGLVGVAVALAGGAVFFVAAMRYARLALERGGRKAPARWHDWAWPMLALLGLVPATRCLVDAGFCWYAASAAFVGVAAALAALAWRCASARAALARL